jgi:hypothetical protein
LIGAREYEAGARRARRAQRERWEAENREHRLAYLKGWRERNAERVAEYESDPSRVAAKTEAQRRRRASRPLGEAA